MQKKIKRTSLITFVIAWMLIILLTFVNAFSKDIIGGVGLPTIMFSLRQVLSSVTGSGLLVVSAISFVLTIFL